MNEIELTKKEHKKAPPTNAQSAWHPPRRRVIHPTKTNGKTYNIDYEGGPCDSKAIS